MKNLAGDYRVFKKKRGKVYLHQIIWASLLYSAFRAVLLYRMAFFFDRSKIGPFAFLCEKIMHFTCNASISRKSKIGPGFVIRHVGAIVVGGKTQIGKNCEIRQCVTFGGNMGQEKEGRTQPLLGDNILIGAGAKILGPIKVGSNSIIGANAVVIRDVPENSVAGGVPAKVIREIRTGENPLVARNYV